MSSFAFDNFLHDVFIGNISAADTFYVMLVSGDYAPDKSGHTKRGDIAGEATGEGYVAGGKQVAVTATKNTVAHREQVVFGAVAWPASTLTARYAVYYKRRGGAAFADELVAVADFGEEKSSASTIFSVGAMTINLNTPVPA